MLQGIVYQLKRFVKDIVGLPITANQLHEIRGYYKVKEDFKFNPDSEFLLGSLKEFKLWRRIYMSLPDLKEKIV